MRNTAMNMVHKLAARDERVLYIGSDPGAGTLRAMSKEFPKRHLIEGISEAHIIGMSAGLAMEGFVPYVNTIATFLTAYREAMTDPRLWPADPRSADNVLRFFLLEKAFYEIEYELSHRPDWLRVALGGALRVLQEGEAR